MSKGINIATALRTLVNKKCKIYKTLDHNVDVIDVSKAENLGNKSWGYIDYFRRVHGYSIVGMNDLREGNAKYYPSKDNDSIKPQKSVQVKVEEKKWHSYADFTQQSNHKGKEYTSSELAHLQMLNHMMEKFDTSVYKKARLETKEIKLRKKSLAISFTNTTIFSSQFEKLEEIPTNH